MFIISIVTVLFLVGLHVKTESGKQKLEASKVEMFEREQRLQIAYAQTAKRLEDHTCCVAEPITNLDPRRVHEPQHRTNTEES